MTTKFPPYQFSVDHKLFPYVPKILNLIDRGYKLNRSRIICQALTEWYQKRRQYYKAQVEGISEDESNNDLDSVEREMLLKFETLLPSIGEPLNAFRPSDTKMYYFMQGDLLDHTEQVGRLLAEGVNESRRIHGSEFGFGTLPMSIKKISLDVPPGEEEAARKAYRSARSKWQIEELKKLQTFIQEEAVKPQIPPMDKREARIDELEEEVKRLKAELNKQTTEVQLLQKQKTSLEQDEKSKALIQSNTTDEPIKNNIATQ